MRQSSRTLLLLTGPLAASFFWFDEPLDLFGLRRLDRNERHAVELQCRKMTRTLRPSCEHETAAALRAGKFDPELILRVHCTRFDNEWSEVVEAAPDLCVERYGGWLSG